MTANVLVYDPTAPTESQPHVVRRLDDLRGKVVGFIDNAKPNFNHLVDDLGALLKDKYGVREVIKRRKRGPSMALDKNDIADLVARCDLVITGSGD